MSGDPSAPSALSSILDDDDSEPLDTFDAALGAVIFRTLALTSAIAQLDYAGSARARGGVERALARALELAERLPGTLELAERVPAVPEPAPAEQCPGAPSRAEALEQVRGVRRVAKMMLAIAPAPSAIAIAQARLGDMVRWSREEQAWIASRQGRDLREHLPRRRRRDTLPDTPTALRDAAASILVLAREPLPDKAGPR